MILLDSTTISFGDKKTAYHAVGFSSVLKTVIRALGLVVIFKDQVIGVTERNFGTVGA